ncbi:MAG: hypothetical protein PHQ95_01220 [Candidatus Gracilibacteria bacterium]|nr:hypothetical protein [Candidatus Gracilibacteria bacterium]
MNKIILLACCTFFFTSCGTTDTSISTSTFTGDGFSISAPSTWITVDKSALPATKNGTIALALTSTDIVSGYSNNMSIIKEKMTEIMTSKKYSIVNYALTTGAYQEFVKLDENTITFGDKDESNLYIFEAKYNMNTPKQKFLQTAKVCGDTVYLMTFGLGLTTGSTTKYEDMIKTFNCSN